ncbi:hypothetical protein K435DRAFT_498869 [Dendrothele bispora CBS 962.96]|uniref:GDS1 winged helix domain-containing protein n=1 Tax=Dendrothele bispora (strain CBS 962.96) TaxID=1314807 RepID=A0A4S8MA80_DENBC|nr:hypothetical protein K435DRAFT_498869 [Dendrothele bispora CBS 962.96]
MDLRRTIKPSQRLREQQQFPSPPSPAPQTSSLFLHPDDANSKVFHAIHKAFTSVDNRAMTVKDLSDLAMAHGLVCQNASAASQAITSYLRSHIQRCEVEQDQPLLLKHTLSGTSADDNLLPALYSRSGGSRLETGPSRSTNFRRGTTVWYLSRATGAACPFARAGIRLSDSTQPTQFCGHKRKRRSLRGLSSRAEEPLSDHDSVSASEEYDSSGDFDSEDDAPPPKQRLTLKLPTLAQLKSRQNTTSGSCSTHTSILIPPYTLSMDSSPDYPSYISRRSPSVPHSVASGASPPPESDEESLHMSDIEMEDEDNNDGVPVQMFDDMDDDDEDDDEDEDEDYDHGFSSSEFDPEDGESPGPRSPSAPPLQAVSVKEEPTDVQGILDQWEDVLDADLHTAKLGSFNLPDPTSVKQDHPLSDFDWEWDSNYKDWNSSPSTSSSPPIKQEEEPTLTLSFSGPSFSTWRQPDLSSPLSPTSLFPDETVHDDSAIRPSVTDAALTQSLSTLIHELSVSSPTVSQPPPVSCVSPSDTRIKRGERAKDPDVVVVKTCVPCTPEICATQVEGISVYQTSLGQHTLLRRIDTDFVNLSPIFIYAQTPHPVLSTIPGATLVTRASTHVQGMWVPLSAARAYIKDHPLRAAQDAASVDLFLSDSLVERFPSALRQFVLSERQANLTGQFGKSFGESDRTATPAALAMSATSLTSRTTDDDRSTAPYQLSSLAPLSLSPSLPPPPLSATEEKIFDELCVNLEWEKDSPDPVIFDSPPTSPLSSCPPSPEIPPLPLPLPSHSRTQSTETDKPLRRSKRVADAKAARTRTRPIRA